MIIVSVRSLLIDSERESVLYCSALAGSSINNIVVMSCACIISSDLRRQSTNARFCEQANLKFQKNEATNASATLKCQRPIGISLLSGMGWRYTQLHSAAKSIPMTTPFGFARTEVTRRGVTSQNSTQLHAAVSGTNTASSHHWHNRTTPSAVIKTNSEPLLPTPSSINSIYYSQQLHSMAILPLSTDATAVEVSLALGF